MRARGDGRIVNVSSGAGAWRNLGVGTPAYSLTKLGVNGLTRMFAAEFRGTGPTGGFFRDGRPIEW
jgi:NAD(P)-dependent dehydrogenase (short-subunit alcohol dehydrogenase family)